jgi:biopolymer transport protein ExbD
MRTSLVVIAMLIGARLALVQAQANLTVDILSDGTCKIAGASVACADIGSKLQAMHVPAGSVVNLKGDPAVSYKPVVAAAASLKDAGYRTKVAHITTIGE